MNHLNKVQPNSNMYQNWITHTWNPLAGECNHHCSYCQVQKNKTRFSKLQNKYSGKTRFDESYLNDDLGSGKFIFVCNQQDLFADGNTSGAVRTVLELCCKYPENKYLFQTKNPYRFGVFKLWNEIPVNSVLCTTIETNRDFWNIVKVAPSVLNRTLEMEKINIEKFVTIEPIMDFDLKEFVEMIKMCNPKAVFIGADSKKCGLPEPSEKQILMLIKSLEKFTDVHIKNNLKRLAKI
jgi:protein gp37